MKMVQCVQNIKKFKAGISKQRIIFAGIFRRAAQNKTSFWFEKSFLNFRVFGLPGRVQGKLMGYQDTPAGDVQLLSPEEVASYVAENTANFELVLTSPDTESGPVLAYPVKGVETPKNAQTATIRALVGEPMGVWVGGGKDRSSVTVKDLETALSKGKPVGVRLMNYREEASKERQDGREDFAVWAKSGGEATLVSVPAATDSHYHWTLTFKGVSPTSAVRLHPTGTVVAPMNITELTALVGSKQDNGTIFTPNGDFAIQLKGATSSDGSTPTADYVVNTQGLADIRLTYTKMTYMPGATPEDGVLMVEAQSLLNVNTNKPFLHPGMPSTVGSTVTFPQPTFMFVDSSCCGF